MALLVLAIATLAGGLLSSASEAGSKAPRAKPHRLYWGAWIGDQITGEQAPYDMRATAKFERIAGKRLSMLEFAVPFANCSGSCSFYDFPTKEMEKIRRHGSIPFLSWSSQAIGGAQVNQPDFQLSDVISGRYDSYIRSFAKRAKSWGHPFFLRFNWEMNGDYFPWGTGVNGNRKGQFVKSWRHVHRIFRQVGAGNATWVWCPYVDVRGKQNLRTLYPGNRFVDWTCLDVYNWGHSRANPHPWMSFRQLFGSSYRRITKRIAPRKPMIIGEMASSDFGGNKPAWIRKMFRAVLHRYKKVRGLIWFDVNDRDTHWPIETRKSVRRAFRSGVRRNNFAGNNFRRIKSRPIRPLGR